MILVKALPHNTFTFECLELKLENCSRNKVKMGSGDYGFILHKAIKIVKLWFTAHNSKTLYE